MSVIFIDSASLYFSGKQKYGLKLDYKAVLDYCKDLGPVEQANIYVSQRLDESKSFIAYLAALGYVPVTRRPDMIRVKIDEIRTKSIALPSYYGEMYNDILQSTTNRVILFSDSKTFYPILYAATRQIILFSHTEHEIPTTNIVIPPSLMKQED